MQIDTIKDIPIKVKAGFLGQRMIVLPKKIISGIKKNTLINGLYFTDIGYFPKASHHFLERKHGSKQYVLIYCHAGEGVVVLNGQELNMKPNTFYILPPEVAHGYYAVKGNPWSIYWLHFTGPQAQPMYQKFLDIHTGELPTVEFTDRRINIFESLISVLEDGYSDYNLEYANLSLWQLLNSFLYSSFFTAVGNKNSENNTIEAAIGYMKEHLDSPLKVNEIAQHFNYSPSHFFTLFKKKTGYSPIHYFNYLKIQKSCQYLSFTTMSVKEISYALGFNDPLYFSRLFKKIMGSSPQQYRSEYRH